MNLKKTNSLLESIKRDLVEQHGLNLKVHPDGSGEVYLPGWRDLWDPNENKKWSNFQKQMRVHHWKSHSKGEDWYELVDSGNTMQVVSVKKRAPRLQWSAFLSKDPESLARRINEVLKVSGQVTGHHAEVSPGDVAPEGPGQGPSKVPASHEQLAATEHARRVAQTLEHELKQYENLMRYDLGSAKQHMSTKLDAAMAELQKRFNVLPR